MTEDTELLKSTADRPEGVPPDSERGGITWASVLLGMAFFLVLAWNLPFWSLSKGYSLGMGGYLPLEALVLTLLLLLFNRFGASLALVVGMVAVAAFIPYWHEAVYVKTGDVRLLSGLSRSLHQACAGPIESARDSGGLPDLLVLTGAVAAFVAGAGLGWLASVALPAVRRRLAWREILVVFVLVSVGTYSCRAVEWLVGVITVPYKDDAPERDFKNRFVRPVPVEQDPENRGGIPSKLVPYDIHAFNLSGPDAETAKAAVKHEKEALRRFQVGIKKVLPDRDELARQLAELDALGSGSAPASPDPGDAGAQDRAKLAQALDKARAALEEKRSLANLEAMQKALAALQAARPRGEAPGGPQDADKYLAQAEEILGAVRADEKKSFLAHWRGPLAWWMSLLALVLLAQVFLSALLRRQWADHEKLMFPHAEVVRALAEGSGLSDQSRRVFASPLFWAGAGLSGLVFLLQGLNYLFPSVPAPNLHALSLSTFISERPWKAMDPSVSLQPCLVSIGYLVTAEISLSIWVFGIVNQALRVAASAYGVPRDNAWAIHGEVANSDALYTGAIFIFVGWLAWSGRRHIWYVVRRGLGLIAPDAGERSEPMSYPVAFWGFWLSTAGILGWCLLVGLKLWVMAVLFGFYLVLVVLFSRLVAEVGLLTPGAGFLPFYPQFTFSWIFGFGQGAAGKMIAYKDGWLGAGGAFIPATLSAVGVWSFIWPSMIQTLQATPFLLTGFKLTEGEPRRKRLLTWLMIAALLAGVGVFLYGTLDFAFERGSQGTKFLGFYCPSWTFNNWLLRDLVNKERMWAPDSLRITLMAVGGAVMSGLLICRSLFYWWPLHPIGMVATGIDGIWICFLVGWILKRAALAYGGGEFSQRVNAFFYGLIVGQFAMAAFWNVVGLCGTGCPGAGGLLPSAG
jgi:hypothetical protein